MHISKEQKSIRIIFFSATLYENHCESTEGHTLLHYCFLDIRRSQRSLVPPRYNSQGLARRANYSEVVEFATKSS